MYSVNNSPIERLKRISLNVENKTPYKSNINSTVYPLDIGLTLKKAVYLYPLSIGFLQ